MVLDNENEPGWYVVHTVFKIESSQELDAIVDIIRSVAPWIVANVDVSHKKLDGWQETQEFIF